MAKLIITLFAVLNSLFVFANHGKLEKAREKYREAISISYRQTAFYPNPDTDEVKSFSLYYTLFNFRDNGYDFHSNSKKQEELYHNNIYTEIKHDEKAYYQYENMQRQVEEMKSFRLSLYGPIPLLKHNWKFVNDTILEEKKLSHYSFIESENKYENKTIKIEFHIYISGDNSLSQFERKSYVDNKLGQIVTYKFDNYNFSNKKSNLIYTLPENYSLKYFERVENLQALKENTKAPNFQVIDIAGNRISLESLTGRTLLLFSSTNCGYSKTVSDFITDENYKLDDEIKIINFYGSDSKENIIQYFKKQSKNYPIIANRKDIEKEYGISGYPVLYLVNENGIITKTIDGSDEILPFLKKLLTNNKSK